MNLILIAFVMIFIIGSASLIGLSMISVNEKKMDKILFYLVGFATGTILATAILDLIPESIHQLEDLIADGHQIDEMLPFYMIFVGYLVFFILERFIYWFHGHAHQEEDQYVCHDNFIEKIESKEKIRNFAILNLVGDSLHNFLDGIIIMVSFLTSFESGILITLAVLLHELPQEAGDFGVLLFGGFTKKKALIFNFLSAMVAMLGGLFALILSQALAPFNLFFLAFSGGGFLYIATTELLPELMKEKDRKKSILQVIMILAGTLVVSILMNILPHA